MSVRLVHPRRKPAPKPLREQFDDALGLFLVIVFFAAGVRLLCWVGALFINHFPL